MHLRVDSPVYLLNICACCEQSKMQTNSISFLLQDFVWAFGQVLAGVVTISLPIRYGVSKFRDDLVNQVC